MGEYAVPLTMGGIGALGGALGSGSAGEDITGFRKVAGLDPQGLLSQAMRDSRNMAESLRTVLGWM